MRIKSRLLRSVPTTNDPFIELSFKRTVKRFYSIAAYDGFDFVVETGSALGLWLGLSGVGLFDLLIDSYQYLAAKFKLLYFE